MKRTIHLPAAAFAGLVTTGLLALPISSAFAGEDLDAKRDDDGTELVVVADDGDDDGLDRAAGTNTGSGGGDATNSRDTSGVDSNDGTNSRYTAVSRDRDRSRGDKTKDWTRDGGDRTRDHSAGRTNDRSRNDTRR
jgi:hypothetical protein